MTTERDPLASKDHDVARQALPTDAHWSRYTLVSDKDALIASQAAEIAALQKDLVRYNEPSPLYAENERLRKNTIPPTSMLFKPCTCAVISHGVRSWNINCAVHSGDTP